MYQSWVITTQAAKNQITFQEHSKNKQQSPKVTVKMVRMLKDMTEYQQAMELSKEKLVVIDFFATWCGPCKFISPIVESMADEMKNVEFLKVDVDDAEDVAATCNITAMPTFQFYKDGKMVEEMRGASANKLRELVTKYA